MMRRGAIIGATFPTWLLANLCDDTFESDDLNGALDLASRRAIVAPPPPRPAHTFSSQSLHTAIYTTLSHGKRQEWHEEVGDSLANTDQPTQYERLEQIAYHYGLSGNAYKAAHFARLAGDKARARQADEAALSFYSQALNVTDGKKVAAEQRLAREGIGDIRALRGEFEPADDSYQTALEGAPTRDKHRLKAKLALIAPLVGPAKTELLEKAQQTLSPSDPLHPWLGAALVWLHAEAGQKETATALCQEALSPANEPIRGVLQRALEKLQADEPLRPFDDLFALFARSNLRQPTKGN
jgi:tetratricopeptide (TPR) repeat protein